MFYGPLPDVPSLYAVASAAEHSNGWVSATGVAESLLLARELHDSERVERLSLVKSAPKQNFATELCASSAGTDGIEQIKERAILELIERWSCINWWGGKVAGRKPSPEAKASFSHWAKKWTRQTERIQGLVQLELHLLPPVCVAWSCNEDGLEMCFGTACRKLPQDAAKAALKELHQMEFGFQVIQHRSKHGIELSYPERVLYTRSRRLHLRYLKPILGQGASPVDSAYPNKSLTSSLASQGIEIQYSFVSSIDSSYKVVCVSSPQMIHNCDKSNGRSRISKWPLYGAG